MATPFVLLGKFPLANKMQKITRKHVFKPADAGSLSMFKAKLHNCGRAGILSKQILKTTQNSQIS